ncbi:MAG: 2,3-bisphosphoglycerate-independent phosphoglycerate mutase, partial [Clostridiales bacterium]|nr:2,3-bisphosphoglycerate-independent phosphoglycerate mutase [Clostridiales bacterium]
NCETMQDPEGKPVTSHTTNPVPLLLVPGQGRRLHSGALCDIAPTLLDLMNCPQPAEMTGCSLLEGDQHA